LELKLRNVLEKKAHTMEQKRLKDTCHYRKRFGQGEGNWWKRLLTPGEKGGGGKGLTSKDPPLLGKKS